MDRNEGIVVHGGTLRAEQMAVGRGAAVTVTGSASGTERELLRLFEAFFQEMDRHFDELSDPDAVRSTAEVLQQEVTKVKPNKVTIRGLVTGLTEAVRTVTPLVAAVEALKVALVALL